MACVPSEDSDQPGQMPRLICLCFGQCHFVGFLSCAGSYFSMETYFLGIHLKCLIEALLKSSTTYVFCIEIRKVLTIFC